ncbi:MAG TPA: transposase, partial [Hanamia sp.]|nr:transposase [Hanamia sp.]
MLKPTIKSPQLGVFGSLADQLDQKHPLFLLANNIDWAVFENTFKVHYSSKIGAPFKPIRLMVSLLILKYLRNLSDENVVEQWSENCYYQYFSGMQIFTPAIPCVPTELVAFRQRIGESGAELILKESIRINRTKD